MTMASDTHVAQGGGSIWWLSRPVRPIIPSVPSSESANTTRWTSTTETIQHVRALEWALPTACHRKICPSRTPSVS